MPEQLPPWASFKSFKHPHGVLPSLRPSCFADRVFSNEINIAVNRTQQNYQACMFGQALRSSTSQLRDARDCYGKSCGNQVMNHDLLWRFVDVQTRLIAAIVQSVHIMQNTCGG